MQFYSNPERQNEEHALPDCEVFHLTGDADDMWLDNDNTPYPEGWYYWHCLPGCMPDSEPNGPFTTKTEAMDHARWETMEDEED